MATITEDYVSFETAKLLKEKGFTGEEIHKYYDISDEQPTLYTESYIHEFDERFWMKDLIMVPTLQMAMKWLRIKHHLSVEVYRTARGYIVCIVNISSGTIKFLEENGDDDLPSGQYTKWEYACEDAIKYCLENLI